MESTRKSADRDEAAREIPLPRTVVALVLLALLPAGLTGWLHPERPVFPTASAHADEITLTAAQALAATHPVLWIDARPAREFAANHLPGAISLQLEGWEESLPNFVQRWRPEQTIVVYCGTGSCDLSRSVARRLEGEFQLSGVRVLRGGWSPDSQARP